MKLQIKTIKRTKRIAFSMLPQIMIIPTLGITYGEFSNRWGVSFAWLNFGITFYVKGV